MTKKYIIEVDESEIIEYWNEQGVKEIGYQEYVLKSCPNIKVKPWEERPQGEWISNNTDDNSFINRGRHCSLCNYTVEFSENFCPNCGASMKGKVE